MGDVLRLSLKLAVGAVCLAGCGAPVFPKELFTVDAQGADYPFMLSETPAASLSGIASAGVLSCSTCWVEASRNSKSQRRSVPVSILA